ncbi:DNA-binding response regulator [Marmoricola endophyticus]|uniref:DNA-binding response regulator n=1 Tax=Marmoricola endophyticus TaxID=2040280 RepID=A0A917BHI7_9ACTN|nr:response regulator transcription factor [Marmoricola endophyticus]GGF41380.1 DNA-binding response regulator [Marmoricola endophyticus]
MEPHRPISITVLNDYDVVVAGVTRMLEPFADRVRVVEAVAGEPGRAKVDVALYDTFAQPIVNGLDHVEQVAANAERLVVYSWAEEATALDLVDGRMVDGFVSKRAGAEEIVGALERAHRGERLPPTPPSDLADGDPEGDWPGRTEGLTARESEIVSLIVRGLSNDEVAGRVFLSINTIKSYIRSAYRKMGVQSRSQAVLWGVDHGFRPAARPSEVPQFR